MSKSVADIRLSKLDRIGRGRDVVWKLDQKRGCESGMESKLVGVYLEK